ncbi:sporulation transcriptional regulator SpoIIID [uncultured Eubacterium sp.]|uniref:sporulation transcriptional regulator SpoIIID n=1 Tax=uncultured Eubacterium sp. TaxID=165185 RepID=UPI0025ED4BD7|nr:sporulation transcriptional regulator SpoIIID [uncultured Eubacterium sp.]
MTKNVELRCIELGKYIAENKTTVRQTAKVFGISKSTVHMDVTKRLEEISPLLADKVNAVLQDNKSQRHIRGGEATRKKYCQIKGKK